MQQVCIIHYCKYRVEVPRVAPDVLHATRLFPTGLRMDLLQTVYRFVDMYPCTGADFCAACHGGDREHCYG